MNITVGLPVYPVKPASPPPKKEGDKNVPDVRRVQQTGRKSAGK